MITIRLKTDPSIDLTEEFCQHRVIEAEILGSFEETGLDK